MFWNVKDCSVLLTDTMVQVSEYTNFEACSISSVSPGLVFTGVFGVQEITKSPADKANIKLKILLHDLFIRFPIYTLFQIYCFVYFSSRYSLLLFSGLSITSESIRFNISPRAGPLGIPLSIKSLPVTARSFKQTHSSFAIISS